MTGGYVLPAEIRRAVKFSTPDRLATLNVADCELLAAEFDRLQAENAALKAEALAAGDELMVRWQESLAARSDRDRLAGQVQAVREVCSALEYAATRSEPVPVPIEVVRLREIVGGVS